MQKVPEKDPRLEGLLYQGGQLSFKQPTGVEVVIREQNGDDEDILSNLASAKDGGKNQLNYLSSICEHHSGLGRKPFVTDIELWPVKDKYYALLKARILNLGHIFKFSNVCGNEKCNLESKFTEDLHAFTLEEERDDKGEIKPKNQFACTTYPLGADALVELELTSGKKVRYSIMNSIIEKNWLEAADDERTNNLALSIRGLELQYHNGEWIECTRFSMFSSKDMTELRASLKKYDSSFTPLIDVTCPKCGNVEYLPLLMHGDFFYPTEI